MHINNAVHKGGLKYTSTNLQVFSRKLFVGPVDMSKNNPCIVVFLVIVINNTQHADILCSVLCVYKLVLQYKAAQN